MGTSTMSPGAMRRERAQKARKMSRDCSPGQEEDAHELLNIVGERDTASRLLPGLPEHLSMQCLARVPATSLWGVSRSWRKLLYESDYFQALRMENGLPPLQWVYALVRCEEGTFNWYAYDPLACSWQHLPPTPEPVEFQLTSPGFIGLSHSVQCASTRTKLIMVAGSRIKKDDLPFSRVQLEPALDSPLVFDTKKRQWSKGRPFRVPRKWCACGLVDEKLYVASGCGKSWEMGLSKSVEVYDPNQERWSSANNLSSSKFSGEAISAVNLGGNLHMVSGKGVFWKVGAIFSPSTGKWSEMPKGMKDGWTGACVVVDGRFFVLEECVGRLKIYDPKEDCWKLFMEDELLKNIEQPVGAPGRICGIVRSTEVNKDALLIRIVHVGLESGESKRIFDLDPPQGQVVAVQVLSRMTSGEDTF